MSGKRKDGREEGKDQKRKGRIDEEDIGMDGKRKERKRGEDGKGRKGKERRKIDLKRERRRKDSINNRK